MTAAKRNIIPHQGLVLLFLRDNFKLLFKEIDLVPYSLKMLSMADKLAAAGQPVNDQDFITFLLGGLRTTYTPFITSYNFACRDKELSLDDFQSELLSFETLVDAPLLMQNQNFAFAAKHNTYPKRKPAGTGTRSLQFIISSQPHGPPRNHSNNDKGAPHERPKCQICDKHNHTALDCFHRFNFSFQGRRPPSELAAMAAESNNNFEQQTWYADSGANAHITANTANLTTLQPYDDHDTVEVGNGSELPVIIPTSTTSEISNPLPTTTTITLVPSPLPLDHPDINDPPLETTPIPSTLTPDDSCIINPIQPRKIVTRSKTTCDHKSSEKISGLLNMKIDERLTITGKAKMEEERIEENTGCRKWKIVTANI
ncbi:hypothetical protein SADUNF_Sadunf06G0216700 [Salix dunnii]|uniref:Uncharacterized protein n=1 Tax=Salix dunnii TaxID=1413687 RepID=A0A835MY73_9ROSI|nr:hypothetical protein SADUNF_Sadunf06G0216700 [Salix dunnii]